MSLVRFLSKVTSSQTKPQNAKPLLWRSFSRLSSDSPASSFGIAFDIDGVVLRGESPIGGSPRALTRLYDDSGALKIPYVFLTNGGGFRESKRAPELSQLLGVNVSPSQVVQGHSPFKYLVGRFENELVIAVGKGEPAAVMTDYGFKNVVSIDDYASFFENIDPLLPYKKWKTKQVSHEGVTAKERELIRERVVSQNVKAVFIVSDSVDWSRDVQVLCDILRTGGLPGRQVHVGYQPPLYFAHDDLTYQGAFPTERFGMGAFRIALESVFNRVHPHALEYTMYGKPNPVVFKNAENVLKQLEASLKREVHVAEQTSAKSHDFKKLYMIGDNPSVDICGARKAGHPWFSILTRTGVFRGNGNHPEYPADLVFDTVEQAVEYILSTECQS